MIRKHFLILFILGFLTIISQSQSFVRLRIFLKDQTAIQQLVSSISYRIRQLDTLISRYILANKNLKQENGHSGMEGFRIQIYSSSNRNAREESNKARAEFMSKFPDIVSYQLYARTQDILK